MPLKVGVVELQLLKLLLHLLLVEFLHHAFYLGEGLLHLVVHDLVHQSVKFALLLHELFALLTVALLKAVVLLYLALHLLHHLLDLALLVGNLLKFLAVLPVELFLVNEAFHHLVNVFLEAAQITHLCVGALVHIGGGLLQQAVELLLGGYLDFELLRPCRLGAVDGVIVTDLEPVGELVARR